MDLRILAYCESVEARMIKTAGGPKHYLRRGRDQGDHPDGAYGWSRNKSLELELSKLDGGHFDAFKFQSNNLIISRSMATATNFPTVLTGRH